MQLPSRDSRLPARLRASPCARSFVRSLARLCTPALAFLFAAGAASGARADSQGAWPTVSVSGFGTVDAVHSSEREADYTSSVLKRSGAGVTRSWSADVDTRLGLQLDVAMNKQWSAVLQLVSEQHIDGSYRPKVEWANLKYQVTPELSLRLGRIAVPMFLAAEYRKVGYAYPWVRPPVENYSLNPFTSSDGVDANYRWSAGPVRNVSQVFYGRSTRATVPPIVGDDLVGLANTSDWGALTVRGSLITGVATTSVSPELFDALGAFGESGAALTRAYGLDHSRVTITSLGINYDPGRWFLTSEASQIRSRSLLAASRTLYASAGWRFGALTPYATWSRVSSPDPEMAPKLPLAGLPPAYAAYAGQLNWALRQVLSGVPDQHSASAGLRWDWHPNSALKLQYDRITPHEGSRGTMINQTPAYQSGRTSHVASVAIDFVY
ncbi:hypothetical protein [Massilia forsythiae]|uniref:hypothetical protein n=1 Tax=Massilia forsythiae TaxID=2728020 RepID=UPI001E4301A2|nr:hypothetical protein [Massilia forsythiae]